MFPHPATIALASAALLVSPAAGAMTDAQLAGLVAQRLHGDRTGACMAVAVVEADHVARTYACAEPADLKRVGPSSAFEIGSVTKTMTATLLAQQIVAGHASLDDRLADWLPPGTPVPSFQGQPILLRHVVTHTSGLPALPSRLHATGMADPYAGLGEADLLASLGDVTLTAAPGSHFAYSNFAMMLLSDALARRAGTDYETLLRRELFAPLGMDQAYINMPTAGSSPAQGHAPNGQPVPAWHFQTNLAGVGGVRATLQDMVRYVQGELGQIEAPITPAIRLSQQTVSAQPPMAMNWMQRRLGTRTVLLHEGGTGGFSSFVAVDPVRQRGVVILSDTTWTTLGGLGTLGLHLVDADFPIGPPRHEVPADAAQLAALAGTYTLGQLKMRLIARDGQLVVQPQGQRELVMGHDDAGDYYPRTLDAVLTPEPSATGMTFAWSQGGGRMLATRRDQDEPAKPQVAPLSAAQLAGYAGTYPLTPGFDLTVAVAGDTLTVQGTGQPAIAVEHVGQDQFAAPSVGAQLTFERDAQGRVQTLVLRQNGQVLRGARQ